MLSDDTSRELQEMYAKEVKLKQTIVENVAYTNDRDLLMFYTASWVHQPYIEHKSKILLEALLVETGHR